MKRCHLPLLLACLLLPACQPPWPRENVPLYHTEAAPGMTLLYVAPDGHDNASGDAGSPLATVAEAARRAGPGTLIRLAPGHYRERLTISTQATAEAPLIIEGARTSKGDWLSVIDGGEALDPALWKARPDIGPGVYAYPRPDARLLLVDNQSVARLDATALTHRLGPDDARPHTVGEILQWPENHKAPYRQWMIPFWETLGGLYTPTPAGDAIYLRLKDGANPAKHTVAVAPEGGVVTLRDASHVVLRDLQIQGGQYGVEVTGNKSRSNHIESCHIPHGRRRINLTGGSRDSVIRKNRLEMSFYGHPTGAWGSDSMEENDETLPIAGQKAFVYNYFKYWASPAQISDDVSIYVDTREGTTTIEENLLDGGLIGIQLIGDAEVRRNVIRRMSSVGTACRLGSQKALYDRNLFSDCNINIRLHQLNVGEAREIAITRNLSLLPEGRGTHIFCHYNPETERTADHKIVASHNTFLGGRSGLVLAPVQRPEQALRHFQVLHNRFIGIDTLVRAKRPILGSSEMFGTLDYNQIIVKHLTPHDPMVWMGAHNKIEDDSSGWRWDDLSFQPPADDRHADIGAPDLDFSPILSHAQ